MQCWKSVQGGRHGAGKGAWAKFKELSPILTAHGASYTLKEKIYTIQNCVLSVVTYGTETRAMKAKNLH